MITIIDRMLAFIGLPTFSERDDLLRQLGTARAFARELAEGIEDKAVIVGSDDVLLQNLMLDGPILVLPGVQRTLVLGCHFGVLSKPSSDIAKAKGEQE